MNPAGENFINETNTIETCNSQFIKKNSPSNIFFIFLGNDLGCAPGAVMNYDSEGNCFGSISEVPPKARKLRWDLPQECQNVMQKCLKVRIS